MEIEVSRIRDRAIQDYYVGDNPSRNEIEDEIYQAAYPDWYEDWYEEMQVALLRELQEEEDRV